MKVDAVRRWLNQLCGRVTIAVVLGAALWPGTAVAHDFWIKPDRWAARPGEEIRVDLLVGAGPERQRSQIAARRIRRFELVAPDGRRADLRARLTLGADEGDARLTMEHEGSHVVLLETDNRASSFLPFDRFNAYLLEEGLEPAIAFRQRRGTSGRGGSERYARHAKAIVGSGVPQEAGSAVTRALGMTLEIVPQRNPAGIRPEENLPVCVDYIERKLPGALLKLIEIDSGRRVGLGIRTGKDGCAEVRIPQAGNWLIGVVWTRPARRTDDVDFLTDFASLSFHVPPRNGVLPETAETHMDSIG